PYDICARRTRRRRTTRKMQMVITSSRGRRCLRCRAFREPFFGSGHSAMRIFGEHDAATVEQLQRCAAAEPDAPAVLCADGHLGYSMPIGGVVGYRDHISPSGVGYDIACGNLA